MYTRVLISIGLVLLLAACGDDDSQNDNVNQNRVCGNGVVETGEECDDGDDNSDIAPDACRSTCRFAGCDDGVLDTDEDCDGDQLGGMSCTDANPGLDGGELGCTAQCTFDVSQCTGCGNGLAEGTETCDGSDFRNESCQTVNGSTAGALGCASDCSGFVTTDCYTCGNDTREGPEACDGDDLASTTCADLSHAGGTLACTVGCGFDESGCFDCGDGACETDKGETAATCPADCGWIQLSAGYQHACGVRADRSVWCWGKGSAGQLGHGVSESEMAPVRVSNLGDVAEVDCGEYFSCARTTAGEVYCWGQNAKGQLGNGTTLGSNLPVLVSGISNAVDIGLGFDHACAALQTGELRCWGENGYGELGDGGPTDSALPVTALVSGNVDQVSGGVQHTCARVGGALWCWGNNGYGQLGEGGGGSSTVPQAVGNPAVTDFVDFDAGRQHVCGVRGSERSVWCWGRGPMIGDGTESNRSYPTQVLSAPAVPLESVHSISAGYGSTCVTLTSGTAYCWGGNYSGRIGDGTTTDRLYPSQVVGGLVGVTGVTTHGGFGCAWSTAKEAFCWGRNDHGQLALGSRAYSAVPVAVTGLSSGVTVVDAGRYRSCAVFNSAPRCWGYNANGELGMGASVGTPSEQNTPVSAVGLEPVLDFGPDGESHNCAVENDGQVWCWGRNYQRALGGTGPDTLDPQLVPGGVLPSDITSIATGMYHNCVWTSSGDVWCWGRNANGECGVDPASSLRVTTPTQLGLSNVTGVSGGYFHTCAVHAAGPSDPKTVSCWGRGGEGQLGNNNTLSSHVPVEVFASYGGSPVSVSTGAFFSCLLKNDGTVWCWGDEVGGDSTTPAQVPGLTDVTDISAGYTHVCALKSDDTVWCWGDNEWGRLGDGTLNDSNTPVQVSGLSNVFKIEAGVNHTCAIVVGGAVFCWGDNAYGQLGTGVSDLHDTPTQIVGP